MSNPIVMAIKSGTAPRPAKLAAARGMLPLAQEDLVQILVLLAGDADAEISGAAEATLGTTESAKLLPIVQNSATAAETLAFFAKWPKSSNEMLEAIILNHSTPDAAIAELAARPISGSLLEAITINQQRLIRHPAIIDAILANPNRTPEAERRAREVKVEFFEKEAGIAQIAEEQRARERLSKAMGVEITEEEFRQVVAQFEQDEGPIVEEPAHMLDPASELKRFLQTAEEEGEQVDNARKSLYELIATMTVKERIFLALKGGREVRMILVRDSNKMVSSAVLKNPKITDGEVESVSKLKGISEELLRLICSNRAWVSNYTIVLNLCNNPRTPLNFSMNFIKRLQTKDLKALSKNKGIPDVLRQMATRMVMQRQQ
ncbi:MAG: hypothetical protein RMM17_04930 [Acidobacteriota bacterium]|nr:hypothetical protein [Blastocatellia bacterium]MDW8412008.1 hypothetical protein [Acidobacteriota bacterium]